MRSLILKDCEWVVTQDPDRHVLHNASVFVEDGRIVDVGSHPSIRSSAKTLDCRGKVLLPGLINTHTHLSMTLFRGYADDLELKDWLERKIWPLEKKMTDEMCYHGALLGCWEMVRTGTTSFVDMYFHMERVADAVHESGLRGCLSHGMIDPPDKEGKEKDRKKTVALSQYIKGLGDPKVRFILGPHSPYTCEEDTLLWTKELAEKEDTFVTIHVAETRKEQADSERERNQRVVDYLDKIGFLSDRTLIAHAVWLTKNEVRVLGKHSVKVAHCPVSNMKLAGGGVAPVPEMWDTRLPVGLGTDGPASNNSLDMFDTMKTCALIHKAYRWDPTVAPAQRVLDMATLDGAKCIGMENELGSIEPGRRADLILIGLDKPNMIPLHNANTVVSDLVYSADGSNVDTTIVDGVPLMVEGDFVSLDPKKIVELVRGSISKLATQ